MTSVTSPAERHRLHLAELSDGPWECAAGVLFDHECFRALEADHVIEKRWLDQAWNQAQIAHRIRGRDHPLLRVSIEDLVADGRNGIWLCGDANERKARAMLKLPISAIPAHALEFVREFKLGSYLERVTVDG